MLSVKPATSESILNDLQSELFKIIRKHEGTEVMWGNNYCSFKTEGEIIKIQVKGKAK